MSWLAGFVRASLEWDGIPSPFPAFLWQWPGGDPAEAVIVLCGEYSSTLWRVFEYSVGSTLAESACRGGSVSAGIPGGTQPCRSAGRRVVP